MTRIGTNYLRLGKTADEARDQSSRTHHSGHRAIQRLCDGRTLENEVADKKTNLVENLAAVAKAKGLEVKVTKPFDKEYGPSELNLGANYPAASFFELTADEPMVSAPVRGMDGVYVLALDKFIESHIPELSEIRSRVEDDYKFQQALSIAKVNGQSFASTVTNELAHGKSFAQTAEATRVTPVKLPPFSLATTRLPEVEDQWI